jgi:hypothetical protein
MPYSRRAPGVVPRFLARSTPDHGRADDSVDQHKTLAWRAWRSARAAQPIPLAIVDRLWADTLSATAIAEAPIAARMFRRSETLYRLLLDWQRWPK